MKRCTGQSFRYTAPVTHNFSNNSCDPDNRHDIRLQSNHTITPVHYLITGKVTNEPTNKRTFLPLPFPVSPFLSFLPFYFPFPFSPLSFPSPPLLIPHSSPPLLLQTPLLSLPANPTSWVFRKSAVYKLRQRGLGRSPAANAFRRIYGSQNASHGNIFPSILGKGLNPLTP